MKLFEDHQYHLTKEEALKIRFLRCGPITHSWRRIAEIIAVEMPHLDVIEGNQLDGMDLCREAAEILGENYMEDPWN